MERVCMRASTTVSFAYSCRCRGKEAETPQGHVLCEAVLIRGAFPRSNGLDVYGVHVQEQEEYRTAKARHELEQRRKVKLSAYQDSVLPCSCENCP